MHVCCVITAESITAAWVQLHLLSAASKSLRPTPSFFLPPLLSLVFFVPVSGNGHNMLVALCQVKYFFVKFSSPNGGFHLASTILPGETNKMIFLQLSTTSPFSLTFTSTSTL